MIIDLIKYYCATLRYSKKGDVTVNTIIGIVIVLVTLFILLAILISRGKYLDAAWKKGPFG